MKKIILLPLDERPCNFEFPAGIFAGPEYTVVRPDHLGRKKTPASFDEIRAFLLDAVGEADAIVLSLDTLLYGGLIPSRLHSLSMETALERLNLVRELRKRNPKAPLYAFQCIMRCPSYSSDDEEPSYYQDYGAEIHQIGRLTHLKQLNQLKDGEEKQLTELLLKVPGEALKDYLDRRDFNARLNMAALELVEEGMIDFMVIPQDDSAPYGYTALDQKRVRAVIDEKVLNDRVILYPGADELGMVLTARAVNALAGRTPKVYLKYASTRAPFVIPIYEDRSLNETVKYHVMASGCIVVPSVAEADFVLGITAPADRIQEAPDQPAGNIDYDVERNMAEFLYFVNWCIREGKPVALLDNAYGNGGELQLLRVMNREGILMKLLAYAGWNTSANSLGTVLAEAVNGLAQKNPQAHRNFLVERYIEDFGYCAVVRGAVTREVLPGLGMNYFDCREQRGEAAREIGERLRAFIQSELSSIADHVTLEDVYLPWSRMFEVGIKASYRE